MKNLKERIIEISSYLQKLMDPAVFPEVQEAVERKDKHLLLRICRKIKIPEIYVSNIASVVFSVEPTQKWPNPA